MGRLWTSGNVKLGERYVKLEDSEDCHCEIEARVFTLLHGVVAPPPFEFNEIDVLFDRKDELDDEEKLNYLVRVIGCFTGMFGHYMRDICEDQNEDKYEHLAKWAVHLEDMTEQRIIRKAAENN